jgi:hypothetical protein
VYRESGQTAEELALLSRFEAELTGRGSDLGYTRLLVDCGGTGDATVTF